MTRLLTAQSVYVIDARRIEGTRDEKLEQLDGAIQELLDIKMLECAADHPNVRFIAAQQRTHGRALLAVILFLLALLVWMLGTRSAHAQSTEPPAAPPAASNEPAWAHVTFGATLEGYYQYDWNKPSDRVVPLRAYDTRSNSFSLQQAALVVEAAPDAGKGRRFGLRLDLQFGQATAALQGSAANEPRPDLYRNVWQAFGSYVFPVGRGLQVDFGKFASILGYETNYAKDDPNFSRALLFNFLPYYHTGVRTTLPLSDKVTVLYMLTNGIQQTEDFNNFKSNHVAAVVKPVKGVTWTTNYYFGQEQPDNGVEDGADGWFRVFDTNAAIAATRALTLIVDVTRTTNQIHRADPPRSLTGLGAYARYQVVPVAALGVRYERLDDDALFTAIPQILQETTLTAEYKPADGFLVRGELRRDWSNRAFFASRTSLRTTHQNTALVGLVWWIGNKTGGW